jgi:ATP-dependent Lon protease
MYCATTEEEAIADGVRNVKSILAENFVRPDEAQKIISKLRERGSYTVIDKVAVKLNYRQDIYEAEFSNLGIKNVPISERSASCSWNIFTMKQIRAESRSLSPS